MEIAGMIKGADQAMTVLIPAILDWELLAEPMPSSRPTPTLVALFDWPRLVEAAFKE
jgi:hypothetical protein